MFICHQAMQREDGTHFLNELQMPDFEELNDMEQQLHDIVNNGDHFMLHCSEEGDEVQPSHVNDGIVTPLVDHNGENSSKCVPPLMNKAGDQQKLISRFRSTEAPKTKISWSGPLHTRFLKAINVIGIHKVTPKKVLKLMNVPGLTRRNVASHLQKYRLFLKRFADHNFPGLKDRDRALTAAFSATIRVLNTKQGATDISIPCPLSFFRTLVEWRRSSFANFAEGFSTVNALSESLSIDPSAASGKNKSASGSHGGGVIRSRSSHMGGNYNGNHSNPFNSPNPNDNGVAAAFGQSGGGVNGFEMNCFHTTRGPSTELGQATFRRNIAEEEIRYGSGSLTPFFAVNEARALGKVGPNNSSCQINMSRTFPQQGWVDGSLIGASLPPPTQSPSQPSIDVLDDVMWSDEFVASLLDDIRPLLDD